LVDYVVYTSTSQVCKHVSRVSFSASYSKTVCSHKVPLNTRSHLDIAHHSDAYPHLGTRRNQTKVKSIYLNTELPYHNVEIRASPSIKQQPKGDLFNRLSKVPWYRYVSSLDVVSKAIWTEQNHAGHFIFECKSTRPYVSRPSRTAMLENPKLLAKLKAEGKPSVEVPEEFRTKYVD